MNLEGFTIRTPLSEFRRVVCHEAGHTLGFPHEHMRGTFVKRVDPQKAFRYFSETEGWSEQDVEEQVLTPLSDRTIIGTPPDETSIMCYQLPGSITRNGKPILGGTRINDTDRRFAARVYPPPRTPVGRARSTPESSNSARPKQTRSTAPSQSSAKPRAEKRRTSSGGPAKTRRA
jgi:hypothetical protein